MDFSSQGISWVGNIYQKFETVCVDMLQEMDNIMAQEPATSVEAQLQIASMNVQKFYNEVMKDILSSPIQSIQVPVTDLSVACDIGVGLKQSVLNKNPILPAELDVVSMEVGKVSPVEDLSLELRTDVSENEPSGDEYDIMCNKSVSSCFEEDDFHNVSEEATFVGKCCDSLLTDSELASILYLDSKPTLLNSTLSSSVTGTDSSAAAISVVASPALEISEPEAENITGKAGNGGMDNASDVMDVVSEVQEKFQDLFLGESFLDVKSDEIDNEHSTMSHRVAIRKTYKKKLRDALLSKLLLATKHNYRKFQTLGSGVEDNVRESFSPCSTSHEGMDLKEYPCLEFCESEWELL